MTDIQKSLVEQFESFGITHSYKGNIRAEASFRMNPVKSFGEEKAGFEQITQGKARYLDGERLVSKIKERMEKLEIVGKKSMTAENRVVQSRVSGGR